MDQCVRLLLTQVMGPGHEHALNWQKEVGDMEFEWMRTYGPTWRIRGNFGVSLRIVCISFKPLGTDSTMGRPIFS